MLAQLSSIVMLYIDASMVGSLGAEASASIGLVSTTTWLFNGVCAAAATAFSVQAAHRIGADDMEGARTVLRQSFVAVPLFGLLLSGIGCSVSGSLPGWLGGNASIVPDAARYFLIYSLSLPFLQLNFLSGGMLRCSGNMRIPSMLSILMCVLDVVFNILLIFPSRELRLGGWTVSLPGADMGVAGAATGTALAVVVDGQIGDARTATERVFARFLGFGQPADPADHSARRVVDAATPAQFAGIVVGIDRSAGLRLQSSGGDQSFDVLRVVQYLDARQVVVFPEYAQADRAGGDERRDAVLAEQFPVAFHHDPCGVDLAG